MSENMTPTESKRSDATAQALAVLSITADDNNCPCGHPRCSKQELRTRALNAHAHLTRLLAAADGLVEAAGKLERVAERRSYLAVADARAELKRRRTAYQEARRG